MIALLALAIAAAPPDPVLDAGRVYRDCLDKVTKRALREKLEPPRFEKEAGRACAANAQMFRDALIADDLKAGVGRTDAERNAAKEIHDMLELAKALFVDRRTSPR